MTNTSTEVLFSSNLSNQKNWIDKAHKITLIRIGNTVSCVNLIQLIQLKNWIEAPSNYINKEFKIEP